MLPSMPKLSPLSEEAALTLSRLTPRLQARCGGGQAWATLKPRLDQAFPDLFEHLFHLYGHRYDFLHHLEQALNLSLDTWLTRPQVLRALDQERAANPHWFQEPAMVGGVCYVDRFAHDLEGLRRRIPYLQELGLTYLHLMPLFATPQGENDGGYAVSDYRQVDPRLGETEQLRELARELRQVGISLVLDMVFNHTSDEHPWAEQARRGDPRFQAYYLTFPDRAEPDAYQRTLRDIFPDRREGSFTLDPRTGRWTWTTFNAYQWDLNYRNPRVFRAMLGEMLYLANLGVEVLRMDAVAFIWKRLGTDCENQPEAHRLLRAYNRLLWIAAPALLFKSEAIVHPDHVAEYIDPGECQLSYNPLLMALLWNSLATRKVRLLRQAMDRRYGLPAGCAWVNYVRCHDDIGWTFSDEDAAELGINGADHRRFLNDFYTGRYPGSFARGVPFGANPRTGDCRVAGTLASLAGLEQAQDAGDDQAAELAVRRILLLHGMILAAGGIPLIYLGDEVGALNDYSFTGDPVLALDTRWVHRPPRRWAQEERLLKDASSPQARIRAGLDQLITLRKSCPALAGSTLKVLPLSSDHVIGFERSGGEEILVVLANFSDQAQRADLSALPGEWGRDLISGKEIELSGEVELEAYAMMWLA